MQFKVKSVSSGHTIKVTADGTLADLHAAIRAESGATEVRVSLNRKTEINGEGSLHELGFRSGDLIYTLDGLGAATDTPSVLAPAPVAVARAPVAAAPAPAPAANEPRSEATALLARAVEVLKVTRPASAHEYLCVLMHAALTDVGFVPTHEDEHGLSLGWRRAAPGLYAFEYAHTRYAADAYADAAARPAFPPTAQIKAFGMGEQLESGTSLLVLQATVTHAGPCGLFTCTLKLGDLLSARALGGQHGGAEWVDGAALASAGRLFGELRVHLLIPLLAQLRSSCERPPLIELCGEVRVELLRHLDAPSLARVGAVCRELRAASRDDALWTQLVTADFGAAALPPAAAALAGESRRVYAHKAVRARELRRAHARYEAESLTVLERAFRMPRPAPEMPRGGPIPQPGFPGMIGGDYDRLPGGLPPSPFGPFGGQAGNGRPGPFGDPDGRLPAGAVPPGSRYDPVHPDMDFDAGFGGAGGVPFPGGGRGAGLRGRGGRGLHPDLPDPFRFYGAGDFG